MAHALTSLRLLATLPLFLGLAAPARWSVLAALALAVAIVTDLLDGRVARSRGTASAFGRVFDHATDCVFVTCGLTALALRFGHGWMLPASVLVAFAQYSADSWYAARAGLSVTPGLRMSRLGRANGVLYFVPLVVQAIADLARHVELTFVAGALGACVPWLVGGLLATTWLSIADRARALWLARRAIPRARSRGV